MRVCPTVREHDGLALSSRNTYLAANQRNDALALYNSLKVGVDYLQAHPGASPTAVLAAARDKMEREIQDSHARVSVEYISLVHSETLRSLTDTDEAKGGILVGAIRLKGENERIIRLIDNVIL